EVHELACGRRGDRLCTGGDRTDQSHLGVGPISAMASDEPGATRLVRWLAGRCVATRAAGRVSFLRAHDPVAVLDGRPLTRRALHYRRVVAMDRSRVAS